MNSVREGHIQPENVYEAHVPAASNIHITIKVQTRQQDFHISDRLIHRPKCVNIKLDLRYGGCRCILSAGGTAALVRVILNLQ